MTNRSTMTRAAHNYVDLDAITAQLSKTTRSRTIHYGKGCNTGATDTLRQGSFNDNQAIRAANWESMIAAIR